MATRLLTGQAHFDFVAVWTYMLRSPASSARVH
jgi:hypothetical protein